jgi:hypothetical protein
VTKLYRNDNGTFTEVPITIPGVHYSSIAWGDYDNDGFLDIALSGHANPNPPVTSVFHNNLGTMPHALNATPTAPEGLVSVVGGNSVELQWQMATDLETPQAGLSYNLRVGKTPGGVDVVSPMADVQSGFRKIPAMGNVQENTSWTIHHLVPGRYYWSVQAVDNAFAGSLFGLERSFVVSDSTLVAIPRELNFGAVETGFSVVDSLTVWNRSFTDTLHVDTITVSGAAGFTIDAAPITLLPRQASRVDIGFSPVMAGSYAAIAHFAAGGQGVNPIAIPLRGKGYQRGDAPIVNRIYDVPMDNGNQVRVTWYASIDDSSTAADPVSEYSIWRRVDDPTAAMIAPKVDRARRLISNVLWDFVASVPAVRFHQYATVVPALYNAVPPKIRWSTYMVGAKSAGGAFYFSEADSGYALDNLSPNAPIAVVASSRRSGNLVTWSVPSSEDVTGYRLYRSSYASVTANEGFLVGATSAPSYLDTKGIAYGSKYFYIVTSLDSSGNESPPSQPVSIMNVTALGEKRPELPSEFALLQNFPNPFNPATTIRFALPAESHVRLAIYDVLGRQITLLLDGELPAGYHSALWIPQGGSGIFFYRLEAASREYSRRFVQTGKMLFVR